jgi:hypothetical protein
MPLEPVITPFACLVGELCAEPILGERGAQGKV